MSHIHPNNAISEVFYRLNVDHEVPIKLLTKALHEIIVNKNIIARDVQLGSLLTGLMVKGPKIEEITALLREVFNIDNHTDTLKLKVSLPPNNLLVGMAGSGKKGFKTINISTTAALVAAACGAYVAKNVSHSTSSMTGSADFLEMIGANIELSTKETIKVLQSTGFGAFSIENLVKTFDKTYGGKFFAPHILSFGLAALISPVHFDTIFYGLSHPNVTLSAHVLTKFNIKNALVITSTVDCLHYIDKITPMGTTYFSKITNGIVSKKRKLKSCKSIGMPEYKLDSIFQGQTKYMNVKYCVDIIAGKGEAAKEDLICLNAGAILYLAKKSVSVYEGYKLAKKTVKSGIVIEKLREIIDKTHGNKNKLLQFLD